MGMEAWLLTVVGVLGSWLLIVMGVEVWILLMVGVMGSWAYTRRRHNYWSARGVSTPPYLPFLGHLHKLFSPTQSKQLYFWEIYHKYGGARFCGLYELHNPLLLIGDPHLIKHICVKDFDHFVNRRGIGTFNNNNVVNLMLFNKMGGEWKALRSVMSPTFTSGKMHVMFPLICEKADALVSFSLKQSAEKYYTDMKYNFACFTIETIASCAFGVDCDSKDDEIRNFAKQADKLFYFSFTSIMKIALRRIFPKLSSALGLTRERPEFLFFKNVAKKAIQLRQEGQRRGDFLDLLLEASATDEPSITHKKNLTIQNNDHTAQNNDHTTQNNDHTTQNNDHTTQNNNQHINDQTQAPSKDGKTNLGYCECVKPNLPHQSALMGSLLLAEKHIFGE
ncbi:Cytochrome P450 6a2-like [Homarus americanus]|uniref:Cytochrome P450 6a2-like n=1 Tax=Homarus americanus TaxID=6706 RepID=A0A8J5N8M7_HOMAM|nr:Cytochrome P450 6a2-like [Homarus americanus]